MARPSTAGPRFGLPVTLAVAVAVGAAAGAGALMAWPDRDATASSEGVLTVYMSPRCDCCTDWVDYMEEEGFETERVMENDLNPIKMEADLTPELASCHTAFIGDYVIEGHVPADDVRRLLDTQPDNIRGLSVPAMPHGTPGMETGRVDPYNVIAYDEEGNWGVYNEYPDGGY